MADEDADEDKQHEPTQKKLDDAREKGDLPRSQDLNTAAAYAGILLVAAAFGSSSMMGMGEAMSVLLDQADSLSEATFAGNGGPLASGIMIELSRHLGIWFAIPAALVVLCVIAQRAFVVAPDKVVPKLERISLIEGAKNKFGRNGFFEFAKSTVKLLIYCVVLFGFLLKELPDIVATMALSPAMSSVVLMELSFTFMSLVLVITLCIGAVDYFWQQAEHLRKNRMSYKELVDEAKQNEGDPYMKAQRRQRGYDIATNRMIADVPKADVVIVNPTHYAVALKWDRGRGSAPVCVAKGVDEVAARIREAAAEAGVPIHRDPPTARALHAVVEIGQEIRPEHYRPVAAAIRFAEAMRKKARARR